MQKTSSGWINGFIGVVIFSGSLPATRVAVHDLDPLFLTVARASIAGLLALAALLINKEQWPSRKQLFSLTIVALGVVLGFPLLSALALRYVTAAHSIVFVGLLPLMTAVFGVIRGGERPRAIFWFFAALGSLLVIGYAVGQGITASPASAMPSAASVTISAASAAPSPASATPSPASATTSPASAAPSPANIAASPLGDLLMFGAIVLCGLGYAEGAAVSRKLGGWQVISWALVLALPVMLPLAIVNFPKTVEAVSNSAWIGLTYVSFFSMFIGFVFWYRGLAQGGIASVGQIQLLQPFLGLALAAGLLHEKVSIGMLLVTAFVILCVAGSRKYAR